MQQNYLIAVCDILGFSKLVHQKAPEEIKDEYFGYIKKSIYFAMNKDHFPVKAPTLRELKMHDELAIAWFSDTILIYTLEDDENICKNFMQTIGWFIFMNMKLPDTRLRVGISYGPAVMDVEEQVFIGLPIVEAYNLEKKQKWSGGALTKKVEERFGDYLANLNPVESWIVPYAVPMENGQRENLLAINWTIGMHQRYNFNWNKDRAEPNEKEISEQPDVIEKWRNTKEFHSKVCWSCFPQLNNGIIKPPGKFW
ncbi:MAG: hypothetical protein MUO34_06285 [Ignavibacteriaceae bacterium]|nr:hypothetical protein [Ignavibacteriaceae bacterium]